MDYFLKKDFGTTEEENPTKNYRQFILEIEILPMHFTGTGDLFAALLLAWINDYKKLGITTCVENGKQIPIVSENSI